MCTEHKGGCLIRPQWLACESESRWQWASTVISHCQCLCCCCLGEVPFMPLQLHPTSLYMKPMKVNVGRRARAWPCASCLELCCLFGSCIDSSNHWLGSGQLDFPTHASSCVCVCVCVCACACACVYASMWVHTYVHVNTCEPLK